MIFILLKGVPEIIFYYTNIILLFQLESRNNNKDQYLDFISSHIHTKVTTFFG